MAAYHRVLVVVDLNDGSLGIATKAHALATTLGAEIELLHVVEFVPVEPMGETLLPSVQLEDELLAGAKQRLSALQSQLSDTDRAAAQKSAASFHAAPLSRSANVPPELADLPAQ